MPEFDLTPRGRQAKNWQAKKARTRPGGSTSRHRGGGNKSSSSARGPVAGIVYSLAGFVALVPLGLVAFLLHGYGVIG